MRICAFTQKNTVATPHRTDIFNALVFLLIDKLHTGVGTYISSSFFFFLYQFPQTNYKMQ